MKYQAEIQTNSNHYSVNTGLGILNEELCSALNELKADTVFLIVDERVWSLHKERITHSLRQEGIHFSHYLVPVGENSKSAEQWIRCLDFLLSGGIRRNTPVIVIGGGVTGDLGAFAASAVLRGVPLIQVPTTLLAMVDSAIGGKTGINHQTGKNLIGTFYQPYRVISDLGFLETLPDHEWVNGLSEILKYGAIEDAGIFSDSEIFLQGNPGAADRPRLAELIHKCASIKAHIVSSDEHESGRRAYLNYGHTFAHALEKETGYERMSHGEAVYLGMLAAQTLSELVLNSDFQDLTPLAPFRKLYRFRVTENELSSKRLLKYMYSDKKRTSESLRFVLLKEWQHPVISTVKDLNAVEHAWNEIFRHLKMIP
ncbi:MAG: 3-dehydroquinate synthase [Balneolaceae bacterium]|nr:MAG: 3-dehydroquinate synthase [Balneolaceae bacterium]